MILNRAASITRRLPGIYTALVKDPDFRDEKQEMLLLMNSCLRLVTEQYKKRTNNL